MNSHLVKPFYIRYDTLLEIVTMARYTMNGKKALSMQAPLDIMKLKLNENEQAKTSKRKT